MAMRVPGTGALRTSAPVTPAPGEERAKLKKACRDFEAVFLYQLLQRIRATVPGGKKSASRGILEGMLDERLAEEMARAGGIGLADQLYARMVERERNG